MAGIFYTAQPKGRSLRQQKYLNAKKTDRPKNVKTEQGITIEYCDWLRATFPGVHFRTDTASGAFNSKHEKDLHNRQQSSTSEPDITIMAARRGYHGLVIEIKADGVNLKMRRDGSKIRVYKDGKGKIIERDYKIRLKDDWASLHIEKQARVLEDYNKIGYFGRFGVGLEALKRLTCWYMDHPYLENESMF